VSRISKAPGFTLVEVMLTVAILALLVALVAPKFSLQKTSVKTVSQQAEALFLYAKEQSIGQQKEITVSVNVQAGNLIQLSVVDYALGTGNVLDIYIPENQVAISFNPTLTEIVFSPTQPIKIKSGTLSSYPEKPINIYFTTDYSAPPNLILFPNSGRVLRQ